MFVNMLKQCSSIYGGNERVLVSFSFRLVSVLRGHIQVYGLGSPSYDGTVLAWTIKSVNLILSENTCFICYTMPNLWI